MTDTYPDRVEVITSVERRRRWSVEEKLGIVAESLRPGITVRSVAQRHEINANQLYTWRRQAREGRFGGTGSFVPVHLVAGSDHYSATHPAPGLAEATNSSRASIAEISFPNGCRLRVESGLEQSALAALVTTLLSVN